MSLKFDGEALEPRVEHPFRDDVPDAAGDDVEQALADEVLADDEGDSSRTGTQVGQPGDGMPPEGAMSVAGVPPFCRTMGLRFPCCFSVRNAVCSSGMTV